MTLVEVLVVVAVIGILANILMPNLLSQLWKARANHIISEFDALEYAVHAHWTDTGEGPGQWFAASEPPVLAPYLRGQIVYQYPKLGLYKYFIRYPDWYPVRYLKFRSGFVLYSTKGQSQLIRSVQQQYEGPVEVYLPGRLIVMVIEKS
jgi:prepilin-type N-terminal cleavage/methylation domain-containing protein